MKHDFSQEADSDLMAEIRQASHEAYSCLVRRHADRYYRLAYRFLRERAEAEDIVQHVFLRLWEKPEMWDPRKNTQFTTWLHRVVVNACLDKLKKRNFKTEVTDEIPDRSPGQDKQLEQVEQQRILEREISALPERQRTALNLCFYEGLSNQEAANVMGLQLKALQSLVMRAKVTLRERMGECA